MNPQNLQNTSYQIFAKKKSLKHVFVKRAAFHLKLNKSRNSKRHFGSAKVVVFLIMTDLLQIPEAAPISSGSFNCLTDHTNYIELNKINPKQELRKQ